MDTISFKPIGVIHTPFKKPGGTPIQPDRSDGAAGTIEVYPDYVRGLADLDGFSHITLVYYFHLSRGYDLLVTPFLDTELRGLFSTRAPRRPNPIGISVVKLESIEENILHVGNVDMVDGTPLLDIKPYVRDFVGADDCRVGWLKDRMKPGSRKIADGRFIQRENGEENKQQS
jgi:tRNA-Thr(GGU) m(6)t(6)A37 methyltransferase TsaA